MASSPQQVLRRFLAKGEIDRILRSFYMNVEQNQMSPWLQRVTMQALRKQGDLQALIWAEEVKEIVVNRFDNAFGEIEYSVLLRLTSKHKGPDDVITLIEEMARNNIQCKRRMLLPLLRQSKQSNDAETLLEYLQFGHKLQIEFSLEDYVKLLEVIIENSKDDLLVEALKLFAASQVRLMTIDEAEGLLRASVRCWPKIDIRLLPSMGNTGQCPQCGTILDSNPVLAFRDMAVIFQHLQRFCCERAVGDGQGVKTRSYFSDLEEWLDHVGPFELVIDLSGATEAALLSPNEKASRVKMIGNRCKTLQKRFCHVVDGRDEERIRPFITAEESIIFSPPGVSPHHVALYIAFWSLLKSKNAGYGQVLTSQKFPALSSSIASKVGTDLFDRWYESYVVQPTFHSLGGVTFQVKQLSYTEVTQSAENDSRFHVPIDNYTGCARSWLCIDIRSQPRVPLLKEAPPPLMTSADMAEKVRAYFDIFHSPDVPNGDRLSFPKDEQR